MFLYRFLLFIVNFLIVFDGKVRCIKEERMKGRGGEIVEFCVIWRGLVKLLV